MEPRPELIEAVIQQESGGRANPPDAGKGARGLMQIEPSTAKAYGYDPTLLGDKDYNRKVGTGILSSLLDKFKGDEREALMSYYGRGKAGKGMPTTEEYADSVLAKAGAPKMATASEELVATPKKGFDPTGASYSSYEEFANAWRNTKKYMGMPVDLRVKSFDNIRKRWDFAQIEKKRAIETTAKQATAAVANRPDLVARINEAAGAAMDKLAGANDPHAGASVVPLFGLPGEVTRAVLPSSNFQAALDTIMFATGGEELNILRKGASYLPDAIKPTVRLGLSLLEKTPKPMQRLGLRLGKAGVAGAAAGAVTGTNPVTGAEQAVEQQTAGEVTAPILGVGRRAIQQLDVQNLGEWINPRIGSKINNIASLKTEFVHGEALNRAMSEMDNTDRIVEKALAKIKPSARKPSLFASGATIPVTFGDDIVNNPQFIKKMGRLPSHTINLDYRNVIKGLRTLDEIGWDSRFRLVESHPAAAARSAAHQIEEDIANGIHLTGKRKEGNLWYAARGKLRTARTLTNLFQEPGVIDGNVLNMPKLQSLVSDAGPKGFSVDLLQSLGRDEAKEFTLLTHRGASPGVEDVQGQNPIARIYLHARGFSGAVDPNRALLSRHVGYVPYDLGRGRATATMLIQGPYGLADRLRQVFSPSQSTGAGPE